MSVLYLPLIVSYNFFFRLCLFSPASQIHKDATPHPTGPKASVAAVLILETLGLPHMFLVHIFDWSELLRLYEADLLNNWQVVIMLWRNGFCSFGEK